MTFKPYLAPSTILDRLWKEKEAERHRARLSEVRSSYKQTSPTSSLLQRKTNAKKEFELECKFVI